MNRTKACLIFNPSAGQSDSEQDLARIQAILEPSIDLDIRFTTPEVDAGTIAKDAIAWAWSMRGFGTPDATI